MPTVSPQRGGVDERRIDLACFELAGNHYAVEVAQVREVVPWQEVTPLPRAPQLIEGVIDLRGRIIPVVDLGRVLGVDPVKPTHRARIAVAQVEGMVLGLGVEAATQVLSVSADALEDPPVLATHAGYDAAWAVVRRTGDAPVTVLSMDYVLESVHRSAVVPTEGGS